MASRLRRFEFGLLLTAAAVIAACASAPGASAATIAVEDGTAIFRAGHGEANDLQIGIWVRQPCSFTGLCVNDLGAPVTAGTGCEQLDPNMAVCAEETQDPRLGRPLHVFAGDRDDALWEESSLREGVALWGGAGDDALRSGSDMGKSPSLYGGPGDDTLYVQNNGSGPGPSILRGGSGDDELCSCELGGASLYGEAGNDRLLLNPNSFPRGQSLDGGPGNDVYVARLARGGDVGVGELVPGGGADVLDASALSASANIDLRTCHGCVEWVTGGSGDDDITGNGGRQVLLGGDGADVIDGLNGSDLLAGQGGDDTLYSRDNSVDTVGCGPGLDTALADPTDVVAPDCETVR
jgi:Ca2+-binding RTX toxin-like protein